MKPLPTDLLARDFIAKQRVPGRLYRGMTKAEYDDTVGAGRGVESTNRYSLQSEGTSFADDPESAESYVNFGRDDPRTTGVPTFLVEIDPAGLDFIERNRQGYFYAHKPVPQSHVTRVWRMQGIQLDKNKIMVCKIYDRELYKRLMR